MENDPNVEQIDRRIGAKLRPFFTFSRKRADLTFDLCECIRRTKWQL